MANDNSKSIETDSGVASAVTTPAEPDTTPFTQTMDKPSSVSVSADGGGVIVKPSKAKKQDDIDDLDDEIDESLAERLIGLTEMFPESLRSTTSAIGRTSASLISTGYSYSRSLVWFVASTSLILFAPVLFETERLNAQEMIKQDKNRLMLGPGTAMSGGPPSGGLIAPPPPGQ